MADDSGDDGDDMADDDGDDMADHLGDGSLGTITVAPGEEVQIRSLNAITGDVAFLGIPNQVGIELAVEHYGDIKGFPVTSGEGPRRPLLGRGWPGRRSADRGRRAGRRCHRHLVLGRCRRCLAADQRCRLRDDLGLEHLAVADL